MAIGKLGSKGGFGRSGAVLGTVNFPPLPPGFSRGPGYIVDNSTGIKYVWLLTPDGTQYEQGADGQYLYAPA